MRRCRMHSQSPTTRRENTTLLSASPQPPADHSAIGGSALTLANEPQEEVPCPVCGEPSKRLVFRAHDALFGKPGRYPIVECTACGMRYVSPRPTLEALGAHYPNEYGIYQPTAELPPHLRGMVEWLIAGRWKKALRRLERVIGTVRSDMKVVDVGCGLNNDYLVALRRMRGVTGVAVDFKPEAAAYIRDKLKMPVHAGTLHDAHFASGSFDLVSMNEYLEHEPHPREVLAEARRITAQGGYLSIEIPYADGFVARLFGSRWSQIDAPRHLVHFSRETLAEILRRTGYELVHTETYSVPFMIGCSMLTALGHRRLGLPTSLDFWLTWLLSAPLLPFLPFLNEYRFAVARAV